MKQSCKSLDFARRSAKQAIIFMAFVVSGFVYSCKSNGSTTQAVATPESVINSFNTRYPQATDVKWETKTVSDSTVYDGVFKVNGTRTEAEFDENGNFLREK